MVTRARIEPDQVDTEPLQVAEVLRDATKIADPIAVAIGEALRGDLLDHSRCCCGSSTADASPSGCDAASELRALSCHPRGRTSTDLPGAQPTSLLLRPRADRRGGVGAADQLRGQGFDPFLQAAAAEVPFLVVPAGDPRHVQRGTEDDHSIRGGERANAEPFLMCRVQPHHHQHLVFTAAGIGWLSPSGMDLHAVTHKSPQEAFGDLGRTRVIADEQNDRRRRHRRHRRRPSPFPAPTPQPIRGHPSGCAAAADRCRHSSSLSSSSARQDRGDRGG